MGSNGGSTQGRSATSRLWKKHWYLWTKDEYSGQPVVSLSSSHTICAEERCRKFSFYDKCVCETGEQMRIKANCGRRILPWFCFGVVLQQNTMVLFSGEVYT